MGVLMLLLNNLNVKVIERGHQKRHKHKTQINRLLKQCNCVTKSTCFHFVYSKSFPSPEDRSSHKKRGPHWEGGGIQTSFWWLLNWQMSILVNHSCVCLIVLQKQRRIWMMLCVRVISMILIKKWLQKPWQGVKLIPYSNLSRLVS